MNYIKFIVDFINQYYHVLIFILIFISFLVVLFKPSKKADFLRVFKAVNKAEELFPERNSGAVKLAWVINQLKDIDANKVIDMVDEVLASPEAKKNN